MGDHSKALLSVAGSLVTNPGKMSTAVHERSEGASAAPSAAGAIPFAEGTDAIRAWLAGQDLKAPLSSNVGAATLPFQRWMKFKEAFSPSFVHQAISACPRPPRSCIDPFGGSGTTALTCSFLGVACSTIEVNPFLSDLIRAKTTIIDPALVYNEAIEAIKTSGAMAVNLEEFCQNVPKTFCDLAKERRSIYEVEILECILKLRASIDAINTEDIRRALRVALGSTLIALSNVVVNGKGRRYRGARSNRHISSHHVNQFFEAAVQKMRQDLERFDKCQRAPVRVHTGDCRSLDQGIGKFDLAIFSPPYPNSFDYTDVYNIELWVLGYLKNSSDNRQLRSATLQSHVQINRSWHDDSCSSNDAKDVYEQLVDKRDELWDSRIPEMVRAYFQDIRLVLRQTSSILSPDGRLVLAVGDSRYAGVHVRVADIIVAEAEQIGLKLVEAKRIRSMRSSAQHGGKQELQETSITLISAQ